MYIINKFIRKICYILFTYLVEYYRLIYLIYFIIIMLIHKFYQAEYSSTQTINYKIFRIIYNNTLSVYINIFDNNEFEIDFPSKIYDLFMKCHGIILFLNLNIS